MDTATQARRVTSLARIATLAHMVTSPEGLAFNRAVIETLRRHNDASRRFTYEELAAFTGVSRTTIARMFAPASARQIELTMPMLLELCRALRLDPRKVIAEAEDQL